MDRWEEGGGRREEEEEGMGERIRYKEERHTEAKDRAEASSHRNTL